VASTKRPGAKNVDAVARWLGRVPAKAVRDIAARAAGLTESRIGRWVWQNYVRYEAARRGRNPSDIEDVLREALAHPLLLADLEVRTAAAALYAQVLHHAARRQYRQAGILLLRFESERAHHKIAQNLADKAHAARSRGGENSPKSRRAKRTRTRRAKRDKEIIAKRDRLISNGCELRNVAGILGRNFDLTPQRIRQILADSEQGAGEEQEKRKSR
jgi:hypothetical protein